MQTLTPAILCAVAIGGALGSVLRFIISNWFLLRQGDGFPLGTLSVNWLGCFAIGVVVAWINSKTTGELWRPLLVVGLLGGLTTFSAFSLEFFFLLKRDLSLALLYLLLSLAGCVLLTYIGYSLVARG